MYIKLNNGRESNMYSVSQNSVFPAHCESISFDKMIETQTNFDLQSVCHELDTTSLCESLFATKGISATKGHQHDSEKKEKYSLQAAVSDRNYTAVSENAGTKGSLDGKGVSFFPGDENICKYNEMDGIDDTGTNINERKGHDKENNISTFGAREAEQHKRTESKTSPLKKKNLEVRVKLRCAEGTKLISRGVKNDFVGGHRNYWNIPRPCNYWIGSLPEAAPTVVSNLAPPIHAKIPSTVQRKKGDKYSPYESADKQKTEFSNSTYMSSLDKYAIFPSESEKLTCFIGPYVDFSECDLADSKHRPSYCKRKSNNVLSSSESMPGSASSSQNASPIKNVIASNNEMEKKSYCINCGKYGHLFKKCNFPILSFGLIGYHYDPCTQEVSFIMIQSKNTFHFLDFIRGKYDLNDIESIGRLFRNMTNTEISVLSCKNFDSIWLDTYHDIYVLNEMQENQKKISKTKYEYLMHGYTIDGQFYDLNYFLDMNQCSTVEISWSFPKGRRNYKESDLMCAIREFEEETGLKRKYFEIKEPKKIYCETYTGDNSIEYQHRYFLAEFHQKISLEISHTNSHQVIEIGMLKWLTEVEAIANINPMYHQRIQIVRSFVQETIESKQRTSNRRYSCNQPSNTLNMPK